MLTVIILIFTFFIGPRRPSKEKERTYECGIRSSEPVHPRMDIHFYRLAILFMILGAEIVFFFPWALALANSEDRSSRIVALIDMAVFVVVLIAGFIYAWAKGAFVWVKPIGKTD
ncbi:MAG: NADH-quinone oxidoreductase subunit A [bacterium]